MARRSVLLLGATATFTVSALVGLGGSSSAAPTCAGSSWAGNYYANTTLSGTPVCRDDASPNFDWGAGAPIAGVPANNFSVAWTRTVRLAAGDYRFLAGADNGVRLFVDGTRVINNWKNGGYTERTATRTLGAGDHVIVLEFQETTGNARISFSWTGPTPMPVGPNATTTTTTVPTTTTTTVPTTTTTTLPTTTTTTVPTTTTTTLPTTTTTTVPTTTTTTTVPSTTTTTTVPTGGTVLFSTGFDTAGTGVTNGMVRPSYGPHLTPRAGVVANGALFRDPAMTEWEDVLLRAPVGPLTGDRFLEAEITVLANGTDAHPALLFMDDPGTTSGGCAGGSTMDWAEFDPWNNMDLGKISFVVNGCYDSRSHVFTGVMGAYQTYTLRAELRGSVVSMFVNGALVLQTTLPRTIGPLPYGGLRIGQYGSDGGYEQYRIERFSYGTL